MTPGIGYYSLALEQNIMILLINAREKVSRKSRWSTLTNTQKEEQVLRWFTFRNIKTLLFLFIWTLFDLENESSA